MCGRIDVEAAVQSGTSKQEATPVMCSDVMPQVTFSTFKSLGLLSSGPVPCTLACVAALPQGCVQCAIVSYMLQYILHPYAADKRAFLACAACGHDAGAAGRLQVTVRLTRATVRRLKRRLTRVSP